jgi:hypothetical protein
MSSITDKFIRLNKLRKIKRKCLTQIDAYGKYSLSQEMEALMDKKPESPKRKLQWYLDFINSRIDGLPNTELFDLWNKLRGAIYGRLGVFAIPDSEMVKWEDRKNQAKEFQALLKNSLQKILNAYDIVKKKKKIIPFTGPFDIAEDLGVEEIAPLVKLTSTFGLQKKPLSKALEKYIPIIHPLEMRVMVPGERTFLYFAKPEEKLLTEFLSVLGQFDLNLIQKCQRPDCRGYFLKGTKKEKRYCSNRCAWVMASRERRTIQPEREKEKKRRSYERRKKREVGPNVKVTRRSRKEG